MSLLKANSVQIGQSATATQNFTLSVPSSPDGTIKLARGNSGATTADIFSVNSTGAITGAIINGGAITLGTAQNSTSGTAIDFTGIPSWAKRITAMLYNVSVSGSSQIQVQLGTSSGFNTSGYDSYMALAYGTNQVATASIATGFGIWNGATTSLRFASMIITKFTGDAWLATVTAGFGDGATSGSITGGGGISLASPLDRVRITTVNGTDTFDLGSINIMYEG